MKEIFLKINFKEKVNLFGVMVDPIKEIGNKAKWMGKEYSHGQMENDIKDNIKTIRKMDMENFILRLKFIKDIGKRVNPMEKEK